MMIQSPPWRLIIDQKPGDAHINMAIDEVLLEEQIANDLPPTIRFYSWAAPSLSLGYSQNLEIVNRPACQALGISVVKRITGGKAILHWHDFTYSVVARENHPGFTGSIMDTYQMISKALAGGLKYLGVDFEVFTELENRDSGGACFSNRSPYELTAQGKKLLGSAQRRKGGAALQHGSLPIINTSRLLFQSLEFPDQGQRQQALIKYQQKATSLADVLGYRPTFDEIAIAMVRGMSVAFNIAFFLDQLQAEEWNQVQKISFTNYPNLLGGG